MVKLCAIYKQKLQDDGTLAEGTVAQCVAYFPRTKDEMITAITARFNIGVGNLTEVEEGKAWTATMVKKEGRWKLTFIFHEFGEKPVFSELLKKYKAAVAEEAAVIIGAPIDYDTVNWVNNPYF